MLLIFEITVWSLMAHKIKFTYRVKQKLCVKVKEWSSVAL